MKRVIAFFLVCIFLGSVVVTSWPRLFLPSLDFIFDSAKISRDVGVQQLQSAVVRLTVLARPEEPGVTHPVVQRRGTGFNVEPTGVIITNHHVVRNAVRIVVTFPDGTVCKVRDWSGKPELDLAVLELENVPQSLPSIRLGDSDRVGIGDRILVIGNPLGLENIAISGTVSRILDYSDDGIPVLGLAAPIHPGNSGSPVVDRSGGAVGVVFAGIQAGDEPQGLALPINSVRDYLAEIAIQ
ncbi:MAG: serine protease [Candidatus Desulforudis sp.]|nr:serine protease [Desulforudis sp.]